jgi:hypothetical protein
MEAEGQGAVLVRILLVARVLEEMGQLFLVVLEAVARTPPHLLLVLLEAVEAVAVRTTQERPTDKLEAQGEAVDHLEARGHLLQAQIRQAVLDYMVAVAVVVQSVQAG